MRAPGHISAPVQTSCELKILAETGLSPGFTCITNLSNLISIGVKGSEIHDGLDSHLLEVMKPYRCGLSAAVEIRANLIEIWCSFLLDRISP